MIFGLRIMVEKTYDDPFVKLRNLCFSPLHVAADNGELNVYQYFVGKIRYINPVNQQKILHTNPVVYPLGGEYVKKPKQMYRRARPKNVRMNRKYRTTQPGIQRAIKPMETPKVNKYRNRKKIEYRITLSLFGFPLEREKGLNSLSTDFG